MKSRPEGLDHGVLLGDGHEGRLAAMKSRPEGLDHLHTDSVDDLVVVAAMKSRPEGLDHHVVCRRSCRTSQLPQ